MAIDSAAKRRALSGVIAGLLLVGATPDVLKPIGWRQNAGWGYSGIAAGAPSVTPETPIVCVLDPETLRIPVVARDILGVPVHARDRLGIPVFKRDVLRC